MSMIDRRKFIQISASAGVGALTWSDLIQKALAVKAHNVKGSIEDVEHIVILMQENRSFDHYFGTMRGMRGYGDRFPIPLESGERAFHQSDGEKIIPPYHADKNSSNAGFIKGTPHNFPDMQAAWNQGKYGYWPLYKTPYSMAYYTREEIPFQYALAEAFTASDAHHCSVATGTDPNRIMFWSGSNFDPVKRAAGINCTDVDSEPVNLRCWIKGTMPEPGYTYQGNPLTWPTIPDVLEEAGISWRIYQDPNNNWTGAMHGCLAFESFRNAKPGSPIYENGMKEWSLDDLRSHVENNSLPAVSWVLPSQDDSEHPGAPSSPYRGGDFTHQVLDALASNPEVWSKTVFFLTFDENDGLFDHIPAPAVPSYDAEGRLMGKSTIDLKGMYFNSDQSDSEVARKKLREGEDVPSRQYLDERDTISGSIRPWGFGPRVPLYIVSPWSKGGWVHSEVADHTSVGQFIEKRFGITLPAISPWHRSVASDLVSAFDFKTPNDPHFPAMPDTSDHASKDEASRSLPIAGPPDQPAPLYQELGSRYSRALPYKLQVDYAFTEDNSIRLRFINAGTAGVVFHVYDLHRLDQIPKRYTVEAGKELFDDWLGYGEKGDFDLEVFGPNGFFRKYKGQITDPHLRTTIVYEEDNGKLVLKTTNESDVKLEVNLKDNAYQYDTFGTKTLPPSGSFSMDWSLEKSGNWYDFSLESGDRYLFRFAGRMETGKDSISDPAMGV
ncbi:phosphocholine-specific phospholipase C [Membranihabitans maritimus]|uniref:phosphocholine-specific phospholipase C n=1 Tax=Membranihabitans maritimus TaxID=2904244 RepID=UPI003F71AF4E